MSHHTQEQFEALVRATCEPNHAEFIISADKFCSSCKTVNEVMQAMAQVLALSATNVNDPEGFIGEIAKNAFRCIQFAEKMSATFGEGSNVTNH